MPTKHIIQQGESTISLSEQYGFFAQTIWNHADNAELKRLRKDMNVLSPGDRMLVPDKCLKDVSKPTGQKHRFRRKGVPAKFRLQIFDGEKLRAKQDYRFTIDGAIFTGKTDSSGVLDLYVSPAAKEGTLVIGPDHFELVVDFGHLNPISEVSGVQMRLNNLGYACGEANGELNEATRVALQKFQRRFSIAESGEADEATRKKLEQMHDEAHQFQERK